MRPSIGLFAIVPLALLVGACTPSFASGGSAQQLGEADAGKTVALRPRQQFHIVLGGNPTTGYQWELAQVDEKVIKSLGQPKYKADSKATGSGGSYDFGFQAVAAGQAEVQLIYHRSFEKGVAPLKTFQVTVVVQ